VALSAPLLPLIERRPELRAARDGVVAASLGLLAVTTLALGSDALTARPLLVVMVLIPATAAVVRWKVSPALLVLGGAVIGTLLGV
jgi:chromate transport protein ChrA